MAALFSSFISAVILVVQCTSTVFTQTTPTPSSLTCQGYIDDGNCNFYSECVESRIPCGEGGYTLGYGYKYCNRFDQHRNRFNNEVSKLIFFALCHCSTAKPQFQGRQWIDGVRPCLMEEIQQSDVYTTPSIAAASTACDNLRILAFNSHPTCYVTHGFCSIVTSPSNIHGLFNALDYGRDFVGTYWKDAWAQVYRKVKCTTEITIYLCIYN